MAVGIPTAASSAAMDQRSSDASSRTPSMTFTANSTTSTAPLHLIWYDPINIWVAEVMTDLRWSWDGLQVSNCAWQDQWEHWYGPSGWNKYTGPFYYGPDYNFSSGRYTWCKVNTAVSFVNLAFCNPSKFTHISVYQNIAYGNRDGSRDWLGDTVAAGDCEQFLNKRHIRSTAVVSLEYLG